MGSEKSESPSAQEEEDETDSTKEEADTDEENAIAQSSTSDPWSQLLSQTFDELQENFDDTVESYLQQNPEMELQQAEEKAFSDLRSDYRRQLIQEYEDLMNLVTVLIKDPVHRQVFETSKNHQINDGFGLEESIRVSIRKRKYLLDQMFEKKPATFLLRRNTKRGKDTQSKAPTTRYSTVYVICTNRSKQFSKCQWNVKIGLL